MFRLNCCGERLNWEDGNKSCIAGVGGEGGGLHNATAWSRHPLLSALRSGTNVIFYKKKNKNP